MRLLQQLETLLEDALVNDRPFGVARGVRDSSASVGLRVIG
ncbi:MAG: hypothetical protein ABUL62_27130 [Myxococcales bacterium]